VHTTERKAEPLRDVNKEVSMEDNAKQIKCLVMSHQLNAEIARYITMSNKSFGNMAMLRFVGSPLTNKN
jgi:hypothetical protein